MPLKYLVRADVPRPMRSTMADGPLIVAVGRLADGHEMSVRVQMWERDPAVRGDQHGQLEVIGKPAGEPRELKLGDRVELMAGGTVVLTCTVAAPVWDGPMGWTRE